jgi:hypothetical protein
MMMMKEAIIPGGISGARDKKLKGVNLVIV